MYPEARGDRLPGRRDAHELGAPAPGSGFGSLRRRLLLDYTRTLVAVISKPVACSPHHSIEQRVARWLLTMSDYAASSEFFMVGLRRKSCACYRFIRQQYEDLHAELPRLLSGK